MVRASAPSPGRCWSRLGPDATLLTIDTNADFTRYLKESIDDPRLVTVTGSAADVEKILADRSSWIRRLRALRPAVLDASAWRR